MGQCNRLGWATRLAVLSALLGGIATARAADDVAPAEDLRGADTLGTPDVAEAEGASGPNHGRLSISATSDFTTAYFFRGILQERNGFIWQPAAEAALDLWNGEDDAILQDVSLGFGVWNSFQTAKTGATGSGPSNLYETDYYPSLTLGWRGGLETSVTYNIYTSPNGAFLTTHEVALGLGYDDSDLLGAWALSPTATFAFETENTSFGDGEDGYAEFGIEPSVALSLPFDPAGDYPVTASFPLAVGISLYDYYDDGVDNDTFGFFSFGIATNVPLAFIPEDFGAWSAGLGINVLVMNDTLKAINSGDNPYPVGTASIAMEY